MIPTAEQEPEVTTSRPVSGLTRAFRWVSASAGTAVAGAICLVIVIFPILFLTYSLLFWIGSGRAAEACQREAMANPRLGAVERVDTEFFPASFECRFENPDPSG